MGRGYGSVGDGVGGVFVVDLGGKNVEIGGEDISVFVVVGEVGMVVINVRGIDCDGFGSSSWWVVVGISVVVVGGDGEVNVDRDGGVYSVIESFGFVIIKRYVGDGVFEVFVFVIFGFFDGLDVRFGSLFYIGDDIRYGVGVVRVKDFDGIDVGFFGDIIFFVGDGVGVVGVVVIVIDIGIIRGDGFVLFGMVIEIDVVDVGVSVNNVGINIFIIFSGV